MPLGPLSALNAEEARSAVSKHGAAREPPNDGAASSLSPFIVVVIPRFDLSFLSENDFANRHKILNKQT
jgi:hypothetical protein